MTFRDSLNPHLEKGLLLLAIVSFFYAFYIAVVYSFQPLLDMYSFRQTQTALTAYWLGKNGFSLAYETPVAGLPWSIPFEFPIYQYIVVTVSKLTGLSLHAVGRVCSFFFLSLCVIPISSIGKSLKLPRAVLYVFIILFFSSPVYLYWGRTFMIETAALFFSIAAIKYFVDLIQTKSTYVTPCLFIIFMTLGLLQKITTALPVIFTLLVIYFTYQYREAQQGERKYFLIKKSIAGFFYFGLPLMIGFVWTTYTDHVKMSNLLGQSLTSSALIIFNWGTLSQRLSSSLYDGVIWERIFLQNLSGILGAAILVFALCSGINHRIKLFIIISCVLRLLPFFCFTNLHIVHTYYQSANLIFFIYAVALALGYAFFYCSSEKLAVFALIVMMLVSNYICFFSTHFNAIKETFNTNNSRDYAIAEVLKRKLPTDKYFIAFGKDWSSSLAFLSERKSLTAPLWMNNYEAILSNSENFIDKEHLGAIVWCPTERPTIKQLFQWASGKGWKVTKVSDCYIAAPTSN